MYEVSSTVEPRIVAAKADDLPRLLAIMDMANRQAEVKSGHRMWVTNYGFKKLPERVERGECYVLRNPDNLIVGAIAIELENEYLWGDRGRD